MLITLSRRTAICQSVAEVQLTGEVPLGAVSHRFNLILIIYKSFESIKKEDAPGTDIVTSLLEASWKH